MKPKKPSKEVKRKFIVTSIQAISSVFFGMGILFSTYSSIPNHLLQFVGVLSVISGAIFAFLGWRIVQKYKKASGLPINRPRALID